MSRRQALCMAAKALPRCWPTCSHCSQGSSRGPGPRRHKHMMPYCSAAAALRRHQQRLPHAQPSQRACRGLCMCTMLAPGAPTPRARFQHTAGPDSRPVPCSPPCRPVAAMAATSSSPRRPLLCGSWCSGSLTTCWSRWAAGAAAAAALHSAEQCLAGLSSHIAWQHALQAARQLQQFRAARASGCRLPGSSMPGGSSSSSLLVLQYSSSTGAVGPCEAGSHGQLAGCISATQVLPAHHMPQCHAQHAALAAVPAAL